MELTFKKKTTKETVNKKLKVLFRGWVYVPHSYAIVNCFQLVHLHKNFSDKIDIHIQEMPYYNPAWNDKRKLVYSDEYNEIIRNFKVYDGASEMDFDLIYSQTFPYNINVTTADVKIPKCVFYTSEFTKIGPEYFSLAVPPNSNLDTTEKLSNYIKSFLDEFKNIYFTSPSIWSSQGVKPYILDSESLQKRNRIVTHGVDTTIFYHKKNNNSSRNAIRKMYNVKDTDTLMISIGAMTKNKGILLILQALNHIVNVENKTNFKLLLKGTGDLYQSQQFLEIYFQELLDQNLIKKEHLDNLMNYIIFTNNTLSFSMMNDLFNASDLYIAPYLAEGFCLAPLESLASGLNVIVPRTGSTKEYIQDIYENGGSDFIHYVDSFISIDNANNLQNSIDLKDLIKTILENEEKYKAQKNNYDKMKQFIDKEYSWNKVSELLYKYFCDIVYEY
jgi:glycosyltransferase involved in cell wall biosynthesis